MFASASSTWSQQITWTKSNASFSGPFNPSTVSYGVVDNGTVKTETYVVTNNGNVAITVVASATATGATVAWDKTTATIAVGASATFTLTLTITGDGSCTVNFAKA
jgi:hypothetical protein